VKKRFGMAWLSDWLSDILPETVFPLGKRTPWYRPSQLRSVPWLPVAFIAPFAVFLLWKGVALLMPQGEGAAQSSGNQPPATELT
jgi:hypothetical protein